MQPGEQKDLRQLMAEAQAVRDRFSALRTELNAAELTGSAGNGQVVVTLRGTGEPVGVHIEPSIVDPRDVATLERLVLAAMTEAQQAIYTYAQERARIG